MVKNNVTKNEMLAFFPESVGNLWLNKFDFRRKVKIDTKNKCILSLWFNAKHAKKEKILNRDYLR